MQTRIGIRQVDISEIVKPLYHLLADEFVLYVKKLNAHWNVVGKDIYNEHLFLKYSIKNSLK